MFEVFISYSNEDRGKAGALADVLSNKIGLSVFFDRSSIPIGKEWEEFIDLQLLGAKVIIVLWSKNSIHSKWVKYEAEIGLKRGVLLPAIIQKAGIDIPKEFRHIQTADLSICNFIQENEEFENFLSTLSNLLGKHLSFGHKSDFFQNVNSPHHEITLVPKEWLMFTELKILLCFLHQSVITKNMVAGALEISDNEAEKNLQLLERTGYLMKYDYYEPIKYIQSIKESEQGKSDNPQNQNKNSGDKNSDSITTYIITEKGKNWLKRSVLNP